VVTCYRNRDHLGPDGARFCVQCGTPLVQPCPYDRTHSLRVVDAEGRSPRACPHCGGLLRACSRCRRLHDLRQVSCLTTACGGRALPTEQDGWATYGGGPGRQGVARVSRAPNGARKAWTLPPLPGSRSEVISSYGNLYAAVGDRLMLAQTGGHEPIRADLPAAILDSEGVLMAEGGRLFVLTSAGAGLYAADRLNRLRDPIPGSFSAQFVWEGRWWLYGTPRGESAPRLLALPLDRVVSAPEAFGGDAPQLAEAAPVVAGGYLYWPGADNVLYRMDGGRLVGATRLEGTIAAAAAVDAEGLDPGICVLVKGEQLKHRLVYIRHDNPIYPDATPVPGMAIAPRAWVAGPYAFTARVQSDPAGDPALLRFDLRFMAQAPEALSWARGSTFEDALFLQSPEGLHVDLALRDGANPAFSLTRRRWDLPAVTSLDNWIGSRWSRLIRHEDTTVAAVVARRQGAEQVLISGYSLWHS
jgi:hypothetical protein